MGHKLVVTNIIIFLIDMTIHNNHVNHHRYLSLGGDPRNLVSFYIRSAPAQLSLVWYNHIIAGGKICLTQKIEFRRALEFDFH